METLKHKHPYSNKITVVFQSMRPPFLLLSPICVFLGVALAQNLTGYIDAPFVGIVLFTSLAAHISMNTFNEFFDFSSGLDLITQRTPFNGGSGSLVQYPQANINVLKTAITFLILTILSGIYLSVVRNMFLPVLGILGITLIITYTTHINKIPWLCLISPGLAFGPIFTLGTYLCVIPDTSTIDYAKIIKTLIASAVPFFLVNNLLLLNQIPDIDADKTVGRKTIPIKYGITYSLIIYNVSSFIASGIMIFSHFLLETSPWIFLPALILIVTSIYISLTLKRNSLSLVPILAINVSIILTSILIFGLFVATS